MPAAPWTRPWNYCRARFEGIESIQITIHYKALAISDPAELIYVVAPNPVTTRSGMVIGGGAVYPELNFTLPPMTIDAGTMLEVRRNYEQIIEGGLRRAADLEAPGVVI